MTRHASTTVDGTLHTLRPETPPFDEQWSRTALASILNAPVERPAPRPRRVRTVVAGVAAAGLLSAGAATAAGLVPQVFTDAFSGWGTVPAESEPGRQAVDPATAERVATAAGPNGTVFSLVAAPGSDGFSCVAVLFETSASAASAVPSAFVDGDGSMCAAQPPVDARFGDMAAMDVHRQPDVLGKRDVRVISMSAGSATSAEVRTEDGVRRPLLRFEGRFYGWYVGHGDATAPALVVGFDADGTEIARTRG